MRSRIVEEWQSLGRSEVDVDYVDADLMIAIADNETYSSVNIQKIFESIDADYDSAATMRPIQMREVKVFHDFVEGNVFKCKEIVLNDQILLN